MKRIVAILLLSAFTVSAQVQQGVVAQQGEVKAVTIDGDTESGFGHIFDTDGMPIGTGVNGSFSVDIWGGLASDPVDFTLITTGTAVNGGLLDATAIPISGGMVGDDFYYTISAYDGSSFETSTLVGSSVVTMVSLGGQPAGDPAPPPVSTFLNVHPSFSVAVIPEPSTFVLGLIGGLAFLFRRRK